MVATVDAEVPLTECRIHEIAVVGPRRIGMGVGPEMATADTHALNRDRAGFLQLPDQGDQQDEQRFLVSRRQRRCGRRSDAVEYFMVTGVGVPPEAAAQMRGAPFWPSLEALAHTLPYDGRVMGLDDADRSLPVERWKAVTASALVMDGGASPEWARNAVQAVTDALPHAERRTLPGQTHEVDPAVLAPVLVGFFGR